MEELNFKGGEFNLELDNKRPVPHGCSCNRPAVGGACSCSTAELIMDNGSCKVLELEEIASL